jgi:hypothetical protein
MSEDLIKSFEDVPTSRLFRTLWDRVQVDFGSLKELLETELSNMSKVKFSDMALLLNNYSELYGYICEKGRNDNPYESVETIARSDKERDLDANFLYASKGYSETYKHYLIEVLPSYGKDYFANIPYDLKEPLSPLRTSIYLISKVTDEDRLISYIEKAGAKIQTIEGIIHACADYEKQLFG